MGWLLPTRSGSPKPHPARPWAPPEMTSTISLSNEFKWLKNTHHLSKGRSHSVSSVRAPAVGPLKEGGTFCEAAVCCPVIFFSIELRLGCMQFLGNTSESSLTSGISPLRLPVCCRACIIGRAALASSRIRFYSWCWKSSLVVFCSVHFTLRSGQICSFLTAQVPERCVLWQDRLSRGPLSCFGLSLTASSLPCITATLLSAEAPAGIASKHIKFPNFIYFGRHKSPPLPAMCMWILILQMLESILGVLPASLCVMKPVPAPRLGYL